MPSPPLQRQGRRVPRVRLTPLVIPGHLYPAKPLSWAARWQGPWSPSLSVLPFSLCHRLLIFSSANGFPEEKLRFPALLQLGVPGGLHSGSGRRRATSGTGPEMEGEPFFITSSCLPGGIQM